MRATEAATARGWYGKRRQQLIFIFVLFLEDLSPGRNFCLREKLLQITKTEGEYEVLSVRRAARKATGWGILCTSSYRVAAFLRMFHPNLQSAGENFPRL